MIKKNRCKKDMIFTDNKSKSVGYKNINMIYKNINKRYNNIYMIYKDIKICKKTKNKENEDDWVDKKINKVPDSENLKLIKKFLDITSFYNWDMDSDKFTKNDVLENKEEKYLPNIQKDMKQIDISEKYDYIQNESKSIDDIFSENIESCNQLNNNNRSSIISFDNNAVSTPTSLSEKNYDDKKIYKSNIDSFECFYCHEKFNKLKMLSVHILTIHNDY